MTQIEIIEAPSLAVLQTKVNDFLKSPAVRRVIDIKYQIVSSGFHCALIIYGTDD